MATNTFAPIKDGQLFYTLEGDANLPVLLFSNSLGTVHTMWDSQMPAFPRYFRILRYDNRGHGASSVTSGDYSIEQLGRDVLALLDHLKIGTACYCGLSVGGIIGQWLALNAGERFSKMVLSNTSAKVGTAELWNARIEAVRKGGVASIADSILARWFTEGFRRDHPDAVQAIRTPLETTPTQGYAATCAAIRDSDFRDSVGKIRNKVLVVAGTHDLSCTPKDGRFIADQIPGAQYVEFNAAHLSNVEATEQYNQAVRQFLIS